MQRKCTPPKKSGKTVKVMDEMDNYELLLFPLSAQSGKHRQICGQSLGKVTEKK